MRMGNDDTHRHYLSISTTGDEIPSPTDLATIFNEVRTERVVLRRLRATDGPAIFAVHGDPATNQYNPAGPHPDLATSEEMRKLWRDEH